MLRRSIVLIVLMLCSTAQAQIDSLPIYIMFGYGGGLPIFQPIEKQDHAVDAINQSRDHSTQLQIGVQFNKKSKNKLELFFKRTRFSFDETKIDAEFESRFPDHYFYPLYTIPYHATFPYFTMHSLNFNYGRELGNSKMTILPYVGVGAGLWSQKEFDFILRDKQSNFGTQYIINLKKNIRPTYTIGARFGINKFPMFHLDLSIHGGPNEYSYQIQANPQDPNLSEFNSKVSYKRMVQSVNLGLVLTLFNEYKKT